MKKAQPAPQADPDVEFLHAHWNGIPPVMRADWVNNQMKRWPSYRALANALQVDEGTIRRDVQIAKLSDGDKERIRNGESVSSILQQASPDPTSLEDLEHKRNSTLERVKRGMATDMGNYARVNRMGAEAMRVNKNR